VTLETVDYIRFVKKCFWLDVKNFQHSVTAFSFQLSLFNDKLDVSVLSVGLTEAAEFRDYTLVAL
jgi:hypothetical protein